LEPIAVKAVQQFPQVVEIHHLQETKNRKTQKIHHQFLTAPRKKGTEKVEMSSWFQLSSRRNVQLCRFVLWKHSNTIYTSERPLGMPWLSGWWLVSTPLKNARVKVSWDYCSQEMEKSNSCSKPPSSYGKAPAKEGP